MPHPTHVSHINYTAGEPSKVEVTGRERGHAPKNCEDRYLDITVERKSSRESSFAFHTREDFEDFITSLVGAAVDIGWREAVPVVPAIGLISPAALREQADRAYALADALDDAFEAGIV